MLKGKLHELKCWSGSFLNLALGTKTFEFRRDDRGYEVGDVLYLREWIPESNRHTGNALLRTVTYKLEGGQFGLPEGFCVLSLVPTRDEPEKTRSQYPFINQEP